MKGDETMQINNNYDYTIKEKDVIKMLKDYAKIGGEPLIIMNGEYYNIAFETEKTDKKTA